MSLKLVAKENGNPRYHYAIEGSLEEIITMVKTSIVGTIFNPEYNQNIRNQLPFILEELLKIKWVKND